MNGRNADIAIRWRFGPSATLATTGTVWVCLPRWLFDPIRCIVLSPSGWLFQTVPEVEHVLATCGYKEADETAMRTVVAASAIGTTIEWYDFLIMRPPRHLF